MSPHRRSSDRLLFGCRLYLELKPGSQLEAARLTLRRNAARSVKLAEALVENLSMARLAAQSLEDVVAKFAGSELKRSARSSSTCCPSRQR
jgi:hypothetical protein